MILMKKDMGGAAGTRAGAQCSWVQMLPCSCAADSGGGEFGLGRSFRPSDVLRSRQGLTVEIGNTDAEGRLVLADAWTEADGEEPSLLIDLATLTGAARVALGPELPAIYSTPPELASSCGRWASARRIRCGPCRCGTATTKTSRVAWRT
jgi:leucyl aminopeptidase